MSYAITTDSGCGLGASQILRYGIEVLPLSYSINGAEYSGGAEISETQLKYFYDKLRQKVDVKTSAVNQFAATEFFERILQSGRDVLHISFSSTFSSTYNVARMVLTELAEEYPERKIYCVDSLCASMGQGMLVSYAAILRDGGKDIAMLYKWVENHKSEVCHLFTVDDLFFLKRGGRLNAATAVIGTVLGVKPMLCINDEGALVSTAKVRGRKAAINELINRMEQTALPFENQIIYIAHADCREDAEVLAAEVKRKFHPKGVEIAYADPVIGSHAGPGALGIFFMGKHR